MAEYEYVSAGQFGEFVKRMEDRLDHANELAIERHTRLLEDIQELKTDVRADMRQMRNWVVTLFTVVVFGIAGAIVLRVFFSN